MKELLGKYINKNINICTEGSLGSMPGKLLSVYDTYFIMETRWSKLHFYNINKLINFWCDEDKND